MIRSPQNQASASTQVNKIFILLTDSLGGSEVPASLLSIYSSSWCTLIPTSAGQRPLRRFETSIAIKRHRCYILFVDAQAQLLAVFLGAVEQLTADPFVLAELSTNMPAM